MFPAYPGFDSIWIATPVGLIPLLLPLVGVLSSPLPTIVPSKILNIPAFIPNPDSFPSI